MTELDRIANRLLRSVIGQAKGVWTNPDDLYFKYRHLQIDKRGSFGERFFMRVFSDYARRIEYKDGDQADWDLKINDYKFEIKTSSLDINKKFQNEGLNPNANILGVLFLCVTPKRLYFKFVRLEDVPFHRLHNRGAAGTGAGYKWDHKMTDVVTYDTEDELVDYFNSVFPEVFQDE